MRARALTLTAAASFLAGCHHWTAEDAGGSTASAPEKVVISTYGEYRPPLEVLDKLIEIHEARRPNAEVSLRSEISPGPPSGDTFHSYMGQRLLRWVTASEVHLEPVTQGDWSMPQEILDINSKDGLLYGVPISIVRQASFFYNPALLQAYGIDVAGLNQPGMDGVQALLDACATIATDPVHPIEQPFALGNVYDWTLDTLFWEALFPAFFGRE
jgi:ABC-type glycerol-3-phosphate transport system substrate-binding protein